MREPELSAGGAWRAFDRRPRTCDPIVPSPESKTASSGCSAMASESMTRTAEYCVRFHVWILSRVTRPGRTGGTRMMVRLYLR